MEENKARRVVDALRERGTDADLARVGVHQVGVTIKLPDGREAIWDSDDTASLEAQVMRNGVLVGFVPEIEGSGSYTEDQIIDAIVRTDYDQPIATQRSTAPPPAPALPIKGGLFRRFMDGFRSLRADATGRGQAHDRVPLVAFLFETSFEDASWPPSLSQHFPRLLPSLPHFPNTRSGVSRRLRRRDRSRYPLGRSRERGS